MTKLGLFCFLFMSSLFASVPSYNVKMDLSLNGRHIFTPDIVAREGVVSTVTHNVDGEETFVDILPMKDKSKDLIVMKMTVGTIGKNGERTILGTPEIMTKENVRASFSQGGTKRQEEYSLSLTAKKLIK